MVFPGLWMDPLNGSPAPVAGIMRRVLGAAARGIASENHTAFVRRLPQAS